MYHGSNLIYFYLILKSETEQMYFYKNKILIWKLRHNYNDKEGYKIIVEKNYFFSAFMQKSVDAFLLHPRSTYTHILRGGESHKLNRQVNFLTDF